MTETQDKIKEVIGEVLDLLIRKNKQYGNSALEPMGIFAKGSAEELIRVRIDDKLNRLLQGDDSIESDEDVVLDVRLNLLSKYVDKFVIIESKYNHKGDERQPLFNIFKSSV